MGRGDDRLAFAVQSDVGTYDVPVASDYGPGIRIPYYQLMVRVLHVVIFIKVRLFARTGSGVAVADLAQTPYLPKGVRSILPGYVIEFVATLVGEAESLVGGELRLDQTGVDGIDNLL